MTSLDGLGGWLYEPDRAVLRAGLTGALSVAVSGAELASGVGYVSADQLVDVPWARRYAVQAALPLDVKALRIWLRDRGIGRVTLKKRGVSVEPDRLRHQLRLSGEGPEATLVLTRVGSRSVAVVVEPH
jgi:hypothetical protein